MTFCFKSGIVIVMAKKNKSEYVSRYNLPQPKHEETLAELLAEGFKLLTADKPIAPKNEAKNLNSTLTETSKNPYVRARSEILNKMTPEHRTYIEKMERGEKEKNNFFDNFQSEVIKLGDKLSG